MSTAVATTEPRQLAPAPRIENVELHGDIITNPAMFDHVQRIAKLLAHGAFTPKHLKRNSVEETIATCFRVAAQAIRWDFDPFAVADETYEVHGRLGYQGKLIIAVVNSRANLKGSLRFSYSGTGAAMTVTVSGTLKDEDEPRTVTLSVAQGKTANEMWTKDPEQKLAYSGAIKWARRHCPQVVMGVHTVEDLEAIAIRESAPRITAGSLDALITKQPEAAQADDKPQTVDDVIAGDHGATNDADPLLAFEMKIAEADGQAACDKIMESIGNAISNGTLSAAQAGTALEMCKAKRATFGKPAKHKQTDLM